MVRPGPDRLQTIPNLMRATLHGFIAASVELGRTVRTDGFNSDLGLHGYVHQRHQQTGQSEYEHVLPRVHCVSGLLKRWLMGTRQGALSAEHLDDYLNEFTFCFNRHTSASRGNLFYRASCKITFRLWIVSGHDFSRALIHFALSR
jgi:hypothetical protein